MKYEKQITINFGLETYRFTGMSSWDIFYCIEDWYIENKITEQRYIELCNALGFSSIV